MSTERSVPGRRTRAYFYTYPEECLKNDLYQQVTPPNPLHPTHNYPLPAVLTSQLLSPHVLPPASSPPAGTSLCSSDSESEPVSLDALVRSS